MRQYLDLVQKVLSDGEMVTTRNGGRLTTYGHQLRFDLRKGFPIVTTKKVNFHAVAGELCWFLDGEYTTDKLHEWGIHIWDANAADGYLGPIYGYQWRSFGGTLKGFYDGVDQIQRSVGMLLKNPSSTRNVVSAWNPKDLDRMALPPCHFAYQIHAPGKNLILQASLRSSDVMVGLPFNISSYALLAHLYAAVSGRQATELIIDLGNTHIYQEHIENAQMQVEREPLPLPRLQIGGHIPDTLYGLEPSLFSLNGYQYHPRIKYAMIP